MTREKDKIRPNPHKKRVHGITSGTSGSKVVHTTYKQKGYII